MSAVNPMHEPLQLTPLERYINDLLRFENHERYTAQSAATGVNDPAPAPNRPALADLNR